MGSIKSWERSYLKAENQTEFWFSYFDGHGFSRSSSGWWPYNCHGAFCGTALNWYNHRDGLLVGYNLVNETTIMWKFRYSGLAEISLFTSSSFTVDMGSFRNVSEVLYVLEKLFDSPSLPLLLGTDWVAPIVSVILQRSAAEELPTAEDLTV